MANIVTLTGGRDSGSANGSWIRGRNTCLALGAGNPPYTTDLTSIICISKAFHLLKTRLKANNPPNKQELKRAAVQAWQSITKEDTQLLVMSIGHQLQAVIDC